MQSVLILIAVALGLGVGALIGTRLGKSARSATPNPNHDGELSALRKAADDEIAEHKRAAEVEGKETAQRLRRELDEDLRARRTELSKREEAFKQRERDLQKQKADADRRQADLEKKERSAEGRARQAEAAARDAELAATGAQKKLEEVAGLSRHDAQARLEAEVRDAAHAAVALDVQKIERDAAAEAGNRAKSVIAAAVQRYASEFVHERTVAVVHLPSDDLKGRLIGREGRNIRALEAATGVDLIIDDTSEAITVSCFNPVRREIARLAIAALVSDGRIHPTRIEEVVRKAEKEVDKVCKDAGESAVFDLGLGRLHPELVMMVGRLKYRQSYAQNLLHHSIEVGYLAGLMAAEIGANVKLARRAGLLHDIGKAVDHEHEGHHCEIAAALAKKYGESPTVCAAIAAHHGEPAPRSVLENLVHAANALSAARPGARREQLASYIKRLEDVEAICTGFEGVERAFALQAGREVRVLVQNDRVDDAGALVLSKRIAQALEAGATYTGSVRVVVVRETRASEYAR